jgi:hypothetical protein
MDKTVEAQAQGLTEWSERNRAPASTEQVDAARVETPTANAQALSVTPQSIGPTSPAAELAVVAIPASPSEIDQQ